MEDIQVLPKFEGPQSMAHLLEEYPYYHAVLGWDSFCSPPVEDVPPCSKESKILVARKNGVQFCSLLVRILSSWVGGWVLVPTPCTSYIFYNTVIV